MKINNNNFRDLNHWKIFTSLGIFKSAKIHNLKFILILRKKKNIKLLLIASSLRTQKQTHWEKVRTVSGAIEKFSQKYKSLNVSTIKIVRIFKCHIKKILRILSSLLSWVENFKNKFLLLPMSISRNYLIRLLPKMEKLHRKIGKILFL